MTNYEMHLAIQKFQEETSRHYQFLKRLRLLESSESQLMEPLLGLSAFDGQQSGYLSIFQDRLNSVRSELGEMSSRTFFSSTMSISDALNNLIESIPDLQPPLVKVISDLDSLQDAYDKYTQTHSTKSVFNLIRNVSNFIESYDSFEMFIYSLTSIFESDESLTQDSGTLALYLSATLTFEEFISRLNSINQIYGELCQIFDISTSEYPLRIVKVESGSLWAKVFGNSKVLAFMDDLLRGGAKYLHRNYTTEGKISAIPSNLKTMDEVLAFSNKLQAAGVDVQNIHDQLAKGTLRIAKDMNSLFENQASVVINGETVILADETRTKALEMRDRLRIGVDRDERN